jgi:hypothetical protein
MLLKRNNQQNSSNNLISLFQRENTYSDKDLGCAVQEFSSQMINDIERGHANPSKLFLSLLSGRDERFAN